MALKFNTASENPEDVATTASTTLISYTTLAQALEVNNHIRNGEKGLGQGNAGLLPWEAGQIWQEKQKLST